MKTMREKQMEVFSQCYKKNGWPKPVFSFVPGVVRLAKNQEELDKMIKQEVTGLEYALIGAFVFSVTVITFLSV